MEQLDDITNRSLLVLGIFFTYVRINTYRLYRHIIAPSSIYHPLVTSHCLPYASESSLARSASHAMSEHLCLLSRGEAHPNQTAMPSTNKPQMRQRRRWARVYIILVAARGISLPVDQGSRRCA